MLALVAGEGELPGLLMKQLYDSQTPYRLCEMEGHASDARGDRPVRKFRVEELGSFIAWLKQEGVTSICFAGKVDRPPLEPSLIDAETMPLVPRMMQAMQLGDDAALRLVLSFFEETGIRPVGAHEVEPRLLPKPGYYSDKQASDADLRDIERGIEIIGAMSKADVGQSCIVKARQALAIEAQPGTDFMMASLMEDRVALPWKMGLRFMVPGSAPRARGVAKGGILVKAAKPGQDLRIDMPTIGPDTLLRAGQIGLDGVVVEAGRVMVIDAPYCVQIADRMKLFFWVKE